MRYRLCVLLVLTSLCSTAQRSQNCSILRDEERRFEAMMRRDTAALARWLSADLSYRHSNGLLEDKAAHLQAIASGALIYERILRDSAQVVRYGRTAVVSGVARVAGALRATPFEVRLSYLAVYRKKRGCWQLTRWQSTRLP